MHHLSVSNYRFSGTIVGIEDNNSSGWADSEWRSLKVIFFSLQYSLSWVGPRMCLKHLKSWASHGSN